MRRLATTVSAFALAGIALLGMAGAAEAATGQAAGAPAACSTVWGSATKSVTGSDYKPLTNIRTGQNSCYERMVFDTRGSADSLGYHVGYVDEFRQDGSGERIPVSGGAILQIFVSAPSYDPATGRQTYAGIAGQPLPGVNITGYRTFKDTRFGTSFEGQTQIGLGVRAKLPFRVLRSGDHLIVDVAHTW